MIRLLFLLILAVPPDTQAVETNCRLCHMSKSLKYLPGKHQPQRQHLDLDNRHGQGQISCHSCHDPNHGNFLRTSEAFPADFSNPSPVCQRCHSNIFNDWRQGVHGKRTGKWNGEKKVWACIECHRPHNVRFQKMRASPPPRQPSLGVKKEQE